VSVYAFAQYVFTLPVSQGPIVLQLKAFTDLKPNQRVVHQTIRRVIGISHTPKKLTINADHPAYSTILAMAMTSAEMIEAFDLQAESSKQAKSNAKLIATIAELLG
jgi:hypothetical protein